MQSAETYERQMRQMKNIIQQKDKLTMEIMEKMVISYRNYVSLNVYLSLHTINLIYFGYLSDGKCIKTE